MAVHIVAMGVSGCGKTTVVEAVRDQLGFTVAEGDDFHPQANIDKMSAGIPLTDEDRWPWLESINKWMIECEHAGENTIISCSALKRSYREVLSKNLNVYFLHLNGPESLIRERLLQRKGHFMPPTLLPSQFATLQPLQEDEPGEVIAIEGSIDEMIQRAIAAVQAYELSHNDACAHTAESICNR